MITFKKITAMTLSLILAISTFCCFTYGANSVTFALRVNGESNAQVGIDGEAVVTMTIEAGDDYTFYSMQDYIKFDTEYFSLDEDSISVKQVISLGEYVDLFSHTPIGSNGVYDRVFVNRASLSGVDFSAEETIITFTLKPLKQGTTQITHYRTEMLDGDENRYSINEEDATVVIGSSSGSESTESTTEATTTTETTTITTTETTTEATTETTTEATETTTSSSSSSSSGGGGGGGSSSSSSSTHTITLVINGEKTTVSVKNGSVLTQPDDPTAAGYVFEGWYTDMAYITEYDFTQTVTGSFTLYAKMVKVSNDDDTDTNTNTDVQTDTDSSGLYSDVASTDWFDEAVRYVTEKGIMIGISDDEFAPNMPLTRGMFVTVLHRIEGTPEESETPTFSDVSNDAWYYEAVKWGQKYNIIYGYSDEEYGPNDRITREQMAAIIYRYAAYKGINTDVEGESTYTDSQSITNYAKPAVKWISDKGFMMGDPDGNFRPLDNASRAETAQVIMNVIENLAKFK